jgi:hypothetical protein
LDLAHLRKELAQLVTEEVDTDAMRFFKWMYHHRADGGGKEEKKEESVAPADPPSKRPCQFYPNCRNGAGCPFVHPDPALLSREPRKHCMYAHRTLLLLFAFVAVFVLIGWCFRNA